VQRACRYIENVEEPPRLADLACAVGVSPHHLHRLFKAHTGITPKAYAAARRNQRVREELARRPTVTSAIYAAGFNSNSVFYASSTALLGMTPRRFRAGGEGTPLRFAVGECWLGSILVAASERGMCAILLGDAPDTLVRDLQDRFPKAELIGGDASFESWMAAVIGFVADPSAGLDLPLDIRGTAFQQRVWQALQKIPPGTTVSYQELASRLGQPCGSRAVGQACAANSLAVAIPCHRVISTDGSLSGYRWGLARKAKLLQREQRG